MTLLKVAFDCL